MSAEGLTLATEIVAALLMAGEEMKNEAMGNDGEILEETSDRRIHHLKVEFFQYGHKYLHTTSANTT